MGNLQNKVILYCPYKGYEPQCHRKTWYRYTTSLIGGRDNHLVGKNSNLSMLLRKPFLSLTDIRNFSYFRFQEKHRVLLSRKKAK